MKTVVLEPYSVNALARLQAQTGFSITHTMADMPTAEVLLVRSKTKVDNEILKQAPKLKLIVSATSGFDHLDWQACQERGVIVAHTPDANAQSTAELTMLLLLASSRQLLPVTRNVRLGHWREGLPRPAGLEGKTLGIVGLGRVGSKVARMAQTFGLKLVAHDPYVAPEAFVDAEAERLGFVELLRASDFVSLHVPLTKETRHLLNGATFKEMLAEATLINTCRGPVVDENDLMMALDEGIITGAAMDVIEREPPPPGHRLLQHPRLLMTPHIGAYTESAFERSGLEAVRKVLDFAAGKVVTDTLPLQAAWFE